MKTYLADTNFYLRFLLQDEVKLANKVEDYLRRAREGKIKIVFLSAVVLEMVFVMQAVYGLSRSGIAKHLLRLIRTVYVEIEDREVWMRVLPTYVRRKIDLIDIFLAVKAEWVDAKVLSFDEDIKKLRT